MGGSRSHKAPPRSAQAQACSACLRSRPLSDPPRIYGLRSNGGDHMLSLRPPSRGSTPGAGLSRNG
eukprot:scaffold75497_cov33-Tisochrysis_lutea.AAC.5